MTPGQFNKILRPGGEADGERRKRGKGIPTAAASAAADWPPQLPSFIIHKRVRGRRERRDYHLDTTCCSRHSYYWILLESDIEKTHNICTKRKHLHNPEKEEKKKKLNDDVIQLINSKLGITIKHDDILECRRIGKKSDLRPRCVLIKLANASVKLSIYNKKKMLKGSKVVIKEDLSEGSES
nr:unnamed protein product [Callosobruchus analis]